MKPLLSFALVVTTACALLTGCKKEGPPVIGKQTGAETHLAELGNSTVRGKVTCEGKAIAAGRVLFFTRKGFVPTVGIIDTDGNYEAPRLPEGDAKVCLILNPAGEQPVRVAAPKSRSPHRSENSRGPNGNKERVHTSSLLEVIQDFKIPDGEGGKYAKLHEKYCEPSKAPLPPLKVGSGTTTYDIELKL